MSVASPQQRPHKSPRRAPQQGFTLIELLMVIAVILILAGITFGIARGVQNAQARAKAKAELAVIGQALEQFKSTHGDYPWINNEPLKLAKSLMGWMEFSGSGTSAQFDDKDTDEVPPNGPKVFVDPTKLSTTGTIPTNSNTMPTDLKFTDPWGNDYVYIYNKNASGGSWDNFGYVLYSKGPDGQSEPLPPTGIRAPAIGDENKDIDNIYAGE